MSNKLRDTLSKITHESFATEAGKKLHLSLQSATLENGNLNNELQKVILKDKILSRFFKKDALTEVPVAGYINGHFISRRIDRLVIDEPAKTVLIMDYKSDTNKESFHDKYEKQVKEYLALMRSAYPDYRIKGYILWTTDFSLEEIL